MAPPKKNRVKINLRTFFYSFAAASIHEEGIRGSLCVAFDWTKAGPGMRRQPMISPELRAKI
jgi:hypothetical protein